MPESAVAAGMFAAGLAWAVLAADGGPAAGGGSRGLRRASSPAGGSEWSTSTPSLDSLREARDGDAAGVRAQRGGRRGDAGRVALVPEPPGPRRRSDLVRDSRDRAPDLGVRGHDHAADLQGGHRRAVHDRAPPRQGGIDRRPAEAPRAPSQLRGAGGDRHRRRARGLLAVHDPIGFRNHVQEASVRAFEPERGQA